MGTKQMNMPKLLETHAVNRYFITQKIVPSGNPNQQARH